MEVLEKYIPSAAVPQIVSWIKEYKLQVKITRARKSKFGDFRAAHNGKLATITVNNDLNQYHFLITLVHEIAHASVYLKHKNKAKPHGIEWQNDYREKLSQIIELSVFPEEIEFGLQLHLAKVKASTCSDHRLYRLLKDHDQDNGYVFLSQLAEDSVFEVKGGRKFMKGKRRRTRYLCREIDGKRMYTISANAEVKPVEEDKAKKEVFPLLA